MVCWCWLWFYATDISKESNRRLKCIYVKAVERAAAWMIPFSGKVPFMQLCRWQRTRDAFHSMEVTSLQERLI